MNKTETIDKQKSIKIDIKNKKVFITSSANNVFLKDYLCSQCPNYECSDCPYRECN